MARPHAASITDLMGVLAERRRAIERACVRDLTPAFRGERRVLVIRGGS
jgi:hypothetical protein